MVCLALGWGSVGHVINERTFLDTLGGGVPKWIASLIMPLGYLLVAAVSFLGLVVALWGRGIGPSIGA